MGAVFDGYGKTFEDVAWNTPDHAMLSAIENNVFHFSAAKTWQMQKALSLQLKDGDKLRSFAEFRREASKTLDAFVGSWMRTEYDTAIGSAQMAGKWVEFEKFKDVLPSLKYETVGDERVRRDHQALDGVVKPVDDPFWSSYYPPNGWNCRCDVTQMPHQATPTPDERITYPDVPAMFRTNMAKEGKVFPAKHPYNKGVPVKVKEQAQELVQKHGNGFSPARSLQEAEERISQMISGKPAGHSKMLNGYNFKGAKLPQLNDILNGLEDTIGKYNIKLEGIGWHAKTSRSLGLYTRNVVSGNATLTLQKTYTQKADEIAKECAETYAKGKERRLQLLKSQLDNEHAKKQYDKLASSNQWAIFAATDRPLYNTVVHEGMHSIWYKFNLQQTFVKSLAKHGVDAADWWKVSEYGASSITELWAEVGSAHHCRVPLPESIHKAFLETLETIKP